MRLCKFLVGTLLSNMLANMLPIYAEELVTNNNFQYDIEMFTFYPNHCESTLMRQLKEVFHCDIFIETGTYTGETAFCASPIFNQVVSVELSEPLFIEAQKKNVYSNVSLYQGSSDEFLNNFLSLVPDEKKLFWLDAHCSGGGTATLVDEQTQQAKSPIWGELSAIFNNGLLQSVILIDDISGYLLEQQDNMRYPHLHQQYQLIKQNCNTAKLYVVGDLAIVYDSAYHNPSVSPIVQDCTISRMFDWYNPNFEEEKLVLEAEYDLVTRCYESEADRILYLSGYCHCRDYRLWRGLIYLGQGNFTQAVEDFRLAKNAGLTHWRIDFYLAYALAKTQAYNQSSNIFTKITPHVTDHELFFNRNYPY